MLAGGQRADRAARGLDGRHHGRSTRSCACRLSTFRPLAQVVKNQPSTRLMLLNWWPALRGEQLQPLADAGEVYFDFAMLEGIEGVARLVEQLPPERVLFGSNFPLFLFRSRAAEDAGIRPARSQEDYAV